MIRKKRRAASKPCVVSPLDQHGMMPYVRQFLDWSAAIGYSAATVELRVQMLRRFVAWCAERGLEKPQDITRPILERYRRFVYHARKANQEPLSFTSQYQRLGPVKSFFKWLAKENYLLANPASELDLPRLHRRLPYHLLTHDEVERIVAQTMLHGERGIRDRAMIETLYSTGIRRNELRQLKLYDVETRQGTLMVREGKGKKDRMVPLGARACHWITRYVEEVRPSLVMDPDAGWLFLHESGELFTKDQLTQLARKYIAHAGIDKPGACHIFRHTMATLMLENGGDIRYIQAILGHATIATTQLYTQVSIRKLKEIHALTHPADRPRVPTTHHHTEYETETLLTTLAAEADEEVNTGAVTDRIL